MPIYRNRRFSNFIFALFKDQIINIDTAHDVFGKYCDIAFLVYTAEQQIVLFDGLFSPKSLILSLLRVSHYSGLLNELTMEYILTGFRANIDTGLINRQAIGS